ncbi:MAG: hypothetical protein ABIP75_13115 [Pyrinomonadaceae bacterium]
MIRNRFFAVSLAAVLTLGSIGCNRTAAPANTKPAKPDPTPRPSPRNPLEASLNYVANGNFAKVWVLSRQDGAPFVKDDFDFIKANSPVQTNQYLKSDDGLYVVVGTNFPYKPEQMDALTKRLKVEDRTAEYGRKQ